MSSISITFVSNYMNHHQLPFCEAVMEEEDVDFTFIQTQAMEEERKKMGWEDYDGLGFVRYLYDDPEGARALIRDSDVVLYGWAPEVAAEIRARASRRGSRLSASANGCTGKDSGGCSPSRTG